MKVKLLSLFLALGIFAMGANVAAALHESSSADQAPAVEKRAENIAAKDPKICPTVPWTTVITSYVCNAPGLKQVAPACGRWCSGLSNNSATKADAEGCMAFIEKNLGKYGSIVTSLVKQGCNFGCSGNILCNSCKDKQNRARCGIVCCAIDPNLVANCMKYNKDNCSNYIGTGSKEAF